MKIKVNSMVTTFGELYPGDCFYRAESAKMPEYIIMKCCGEHDNAVYLFGGECTTFDNDLKVIPVKVKMTVK